MLLEELANILSKCAGAARASEYQSREKLIGLDRILIISHISCVLLKCECFIVLKGRQSTVSCITNLLQLAVA